MYAAWASSIDAFSPKNHMMAFTAVTAVLRAVGLAADDHHRARAIFERLDGSVGTVEHQAQLVEERPLSLDVPLVAQVSRWDRLKDPLGIMSAFAEHVHADDEPHLLLAGPDVKAVADDPEGGGGVRRDRGGVARVAPERPPSRAPRAAADG